MSPADAELSYAAKGRTPKAVLTVALIWAALLALWIGLQAASWLVGILALSTLPAVWDIIRNPPSGLTLTPEYIRWHSGARHAEVLLEEIAHVRLDTRLDFSVKVTLVLRAGAKIRLPFEATPPHQPLEDALTRLGIKTERHHFQLMQ